ncbi:hypothetical protein AMAG_19930 [Allomyces macrogynus ATCC 38327]|uniref:L-type lectin-like domain-containing protein n=1 Tax=Allomyces macrogynus (strain ATCC 38327) TaxID=578462 RepID=A0A0L0T3Z6_ALLM3|nr:hypothetical protein AMAG_19930 [Allomyces macrogynus ATCC 38327]|eukprot:KNE69435.1 hypothetical protein AMAG_19930 [Allomyces macrogynus ATCC 38327]
MTRHLAPARAAAAPGTPRLVRAALAALVATAVLLLAFTTHYASAATNEPVHGTTLFIRSQSLYPPYIDYDMSNRWWEFGGAAVVHTNKYIRLTPDLHARKGWIMAKSAFDASAWSVEFEYKIHGRGTSLFGDGFAFWFTKDQHDAMDLFRQSHTPTRPTRRPGPGPSLTRRASHNPRTDLLRAISNALGRVLDDRAAPLLAAHGLLDLVGASTVDASATVRSVLVAIVLNAANDQILTGAVRLGLPHSQETLFRILWGAKDYLGWCVVGQVPGDANRTVPLALVRFAAGGTGSETDARMHWAVAPEPAAVDSVMPAETESEAAPAPIPLSPPPAVVQPPSPEPLELAPPVPTAPTPALPALAPPLKRRASRPVVVPVVEIQLTRNSGSGVARRRSMPPPPLPPPAHTPAPPPAAADEEPMVVDVPGPSETNADADVAMADADAVTDVPGPDRRDRDYPPPPLVADHVAVGKNQHEAQQQQQHQQQQPALRRSQRSTRMRSGGDIPADASAPPAAAAAASAQDPPRPKWWITPSTQPPAIMQAPRRPPPPGAFPLYIPRANAVLLHASSTLRVAIHDLTDRFHYILTQPINARSKTVILDTLRGHLKATLCKAGRTAPADKRALGPAIRDLDQVAQFLAATTARASVADRGLDRVMTVLACLGVAVPATLDAVLEPLMEKVAEACKTVSAVKGAAVEYPEVGSVVDEKGMDVWGGWGVGEGVRRVAFASSPRIVVPPGEGFEDRRARVVVYTVVQRGNGAASGGAARRGQQQQRG